VIDGDRVQPVHAKIRCGAAFGLRSGRDDHTRLEAQVIGDRLRIAVHDPGRPSDEPHVRKEITTAVGGLGLRLVAQLARRWGWERPDGRLVWAEFGV